MEEWAITPKRGRLVWTFPPASYPRTVVTHRSPTVKERSNSAIVVESAGICHNCRLAVHVPRSVNMRPVRANIAGCHEN